MSKNFFGFFKNSTTSLNSSLASSTPAMSLKVVFSFLSSGIITLAFDLPKLKA